jgi:CTP:molybdopterin cytidylyltransferase MocA
MLLRVLDALEASRHVNGCILCGPPAAIVEREPQLRQRLGDRGVRWLPPQATPSTSALAGLQSVAAGTPVLLTTADHALLTPQMVDYFCHEARAAGSDVVAALASHAQVMARYPGMRRTRTRFSDGAFCGCNLFAFLTPESRAAADLWRRVENERKRPLRMLSQLGGWVVIRYILGLLSLKDAVRHISKRMGLRVAAVILPFPEAAVDVDSVSDWHFAEVLASGAGSETPPEVSR